MTTPPPGRWKRTDESAAGTAQTAQTAEPEGSGSSGEQPVSPKWVSRPDDAHGIGQFPDPLPPRRAAQPKQAPSTDDTREVPVHAGDGASFRQGVRTSWPEPVAAGTSSTPRGSPGGGGTVDASVTRTGNQGVQDVPGIEVLGRRVTPPMVGSAIAAMSFVSLLTFCGKWLSVEPGAALQFFGGMSGFSINGFGFASGQEGGKWFPVRDCVGVSTFLGFWCRAGIPQTPGTACSLGYVDLGLNAPPYYGYLYCGGSSRK